jgi:hypothetical protein
MGKRRYLLLALSVPILLLTVAFSTRTTAATATAATVGTGSPGFTVWPTYGGMNGDTTSPDCPKIYSTCWVILGNPANASSALKWEGGTPDSPGANGGPVVFTPSSGVLKPGQHVTVTITNWPCQDTGGEWDFLGSAVSKTIFGNAEAIVPVAGCG